LLGNLSHLTSDFCIYIFEADNNKMVDEKKLSNGQYMPKKWKMDFQKALQ